MRTRRASARPRSSEEIRGHNHALTPGRYVGAADVEDDDVPFAEKIAALRAKLESNLPKPRS